jgi:uncharacterized protein YhaN
MQDAAGKAAGAARDYARLHVARTLLRRGLERFAEDEQAPLLQAASTHFRVLTGGHYVRLAEEPGEKGAAALAARLANGETCSMDRLSEGTRDQAFLALRLATMQAMSGERRLPFLADDLLVQFDDGRAMAALRLLASLPDVQTILFTHHRHVAEMAARVLGTAVQELSSAPMKKEQAA